MDRVSHNQQKQKDGLDQGAVQRVFEIDVPVFVKNFVSGLIWLAGVVTSIKGQYSYIPMEYSYLMAMSSVAMQTTLILT